jgi:hypothetical protein
MVMQVIKLATEKHAPASRAILVAVCIRWYGAKCIAQYGRSRATLDATGHWTPPSGDYSPRITRHGGRFQSKKSSYGIEISFLEASDQNAQNGPSTQLIQATSCCVERWNVTVKAEEHS